MRDEQKTKEELLRELKVLRRGLERYKQAEHEKMNLGTKESEQTFKTIFDNAADGIVLADVENKKIYMGNNVICQMLGYDSQELTALSAMDIHPEQDTPHVMEQFKKQSKGELTLAKDIPVKKKDGSVFYADVNAFPITLDEKAYLMGIFRDVSERKTAEEKWRSLVETAPSFIMTVDENGTIQSLNRPTGGMTIEQAIGTTVYEHVEPGKCDIMRKSIEKVFKTGEPGSYEILGLGPGGPNSAWYETLLGPVIRDGRVVAVTLISTDITERKQIEKAVRMSEEKYRTFFEYDLTGDFISTPDGVLIDCNQAFLDLFGFTSMEEAQSTTLESVYPTPTDREVMLDKIRKERKIFHYVHEARKITGEKIFIDQNTVGEFDDDNNLILLRGHIIDITDRKKAEEEIRKFKTIADNAGQGIGIVDLEGNLVYVNDSFAQMHQYRADELVGINLSIFHNKEQMERVNQLNERLKREGSYVAEEVWHKKRDNTVFPTLMNGTLVKDERGEPLFMAATAIDITNHKKAQESLRYSEQRYRSVVEDSPVLMCNFLPDGEIVFVNKAYCNYFNKTSEELIGSNFKYLIPEADRQSVLDNIISLTTDSPTMTHEHKVYAPDGRIRWQRWTNRAIFDERGNAVSFQSFGEDITEHKKAEEALKESEIRYRTLFETLPVGVGLSTPDGRIIDANSTFQRMIGYSTEDIKRISVLDTYNNPAERVPLLKQLQENGFVRDFEVNLKRKDGTIFLARLNVSTIRMRDETVSVTVARDITNHRRMERALAENEEKYRTLVECAGDPIFTIDERCVLLFANKVAAETLGYQPEGLVGKTLWDIFPKETADRQAANVRKVIESGQGTNTISLTEVQNKPRWYSVTIEPLKDDLGKVTAAMVIARDVDDIKRAEEQIQKLSSAVESSISGIAIGDAEGNLTYVNHALLEMWGYANENEVLGRNAVEFWQNTDEAIKILETVINGGSWIGKMTAKRKDSSTFDVQICATLIKDENGKPISMMGSFVDISETKRKEEELSRYREQMARSEQLASLGTLSATMAHQLTQPLTVIRLSLDNALDELEASSSSETVIRRLKESVTQVSNITSIVERFRNFARKSSGRTVAEINMKAVAVRIASLLSESARSANIILRIRNMDDLPCPWMNENDLEQLLFALIENTIQATDGKKARHLIISGAMKDKHIELRISDDCSGIPPENIDKIFEPFFTTKPRGQGTGLGLCIVQDVVSRNGGRVRVESEVGKGTTFIIRFPFEQDKYPNRENS
jgi:PAS domain S-box-containing protein